MFENLRQDALFYHHLRFSGRQITFLSMAKVVSGSRGLLVVAVHRMCFRYTQVSPKGLKRWLYCMVVHLGSYLSRVLAKSYILPSTQFEPGVYLSNRGHIILGALSVGTGTIIHERVTIGRNLQNKTTPEIGRNVWIGTNCVISGDIKIGNGVTILPNSVLTKNLPSGVMVQGNPARIVKRDFDNSALRNTLTTDVCSFSNIWNKA